MQIRKSLRLVLLLTITWNVTDAKLQTPDERLAQCCEERGVQQPCRDIICKSYDAFNEQTITSLYNPLNKIKICNWTTIEGGGGGGDVESVVQCINDKHDHTECCDKQEMDNLCRVFCRPIDNLWLLVKDNFNKYKCITETNAPSLVHCFKEHARQQIEEAALITKLPNITTAGNGTLSLINTTRNAMQPKDSGRSFFRKVWIIGGSIILVICITISLLTSFMIVILKQEHNEYKTYNAGTTTPEHSTSSSQDE